jgi:phosphoribosylaminoimidazolecarboxamide formyltransferase/IMP cyclohydrolase
MKRVLISVSEKRNLIPFTLGLKRLGFEIIATGGTAGVLRRKDVPVRTVSEITGLKELLEGRVKTLHPKIFGGILALRNKQHLRELKDEKIKPIDLLVVNLYPFKDIDNMDIGGTALIRSAVKNFRNVGVVIDPRDYKVILSELKKRSGKLSLETKRNLAAKALNYILQYDRRVYRYLTESRLAGGPLSDYDKVKHLRYGENPHQDAAFYPVSSLQFPVFKQLRGKKLSFNNILDLNTASEIIRESKDPAAVIIKHTNPCGVARAKSLAGAWRKARACDPLSAFGGVVGVNRKVGIPAARQMTSSFIEAVIAPGFTPQALRILERKKSLRIVQYPTSAAKERPPGAQRELDLRTVDWGLLVQDKDTRELKVNDLKVVTRKKPTKEELRALLFAWRVVKYVKSNAIVISNENETLAIGSGQTSRIDSVKIAITKMQTRPPACNYRSVTVMASDGFFPFRDSVDTAAEAKISAIIQPGGSIRDKEVIKACNESNIAMVFTGIRCFRH